jgi:two-component system NarL family response regulator
MPLFPVITFGLDLALVAAAVIAYAARPRIGGHLARGLRVLLVGVIILGCAHFVETELFAWFDVDVQLNEMLHRLLIALGFVWVILGFITMRQAFERFSATTAQTVSALGATGQDSKEATYRGILTAIIKRFTPIMGASSAVNAARRVPQLSTDDDGNVLDYDRDDLLTSLTLLMDQYGSAFGPAAHQLALQAAQPIAEAAGDDILQDAGEVVATLKMPITILLVDDHALFREGLASLINAQPDMRVVGQAGALREALALARETKPQLVLMDISLAEGTGLEAARGILAEQPATKIIFLTVHADDENLFAAIRTGAMGYLVKNVRVTELLKRLRAVARGEPGIPPAIARRILDEFSRTAAPRPAGAPEVTELTARETEIIRELARGATNREIAQHFVISENTVRNHVRSVLAKLHLRSRREAASYARDHGLAHPASTPRAAD